MSVATLVRETTTTTGTGPVTLLGAVATYDAFADRFSNGELVQYVIEDVRDADGAVVAREAGFSTFTDPDTIERDIAVEQSTNGNALVNFGTLASGYTRYVYASPLGSPLKGLLGLTSAVLGVPVRTAWNPATKTFTWAYKTVGVSGTLDAGLLEGLAAASYVKNLQHDGSAGGGSPQLRTGTAAQLAALSAASVPDGALFLVTDSTPPGKLYKEVSDAWVDYSAWVHAIASFVGVGSYADKASLPSAATADRFFLQRDLGLLKRDTGAAIEAALNKLTGSGVLTEAGSYVAFGDWALSVGREASTTSRAPTGYTKTFTFPITYASAPLVVPLVTGAASGDIGNLTGQGAVSTSTTQTTIVVAIPSTNAEIAVGYAAVGPVTTL